MSVTDKDKPKKPAKKLKCRCCKNMVDYFLMHRVEKSAWLSDAQKDACQHLSGIDKWKAIEWETTDVCKSCVEKAITSYQPS